MSDESRSSNDNAESDAPDTGDGGERREGGRRKRNIVAGTAIGVGSAAIVAALLYANRGRKSGGKDGGKA